MPPIPYRLAIISDLHLSEGWASDGYLSRNEDFFFDQSFRRFLRYLTAQAGEAGLYYRLIINGDFVDFLQFTSQSIPEDETLVGEPVDERERKFGLGTSPRKTCVKLDALFSGHEVFFQALAEFIGAGNQVVICPGNHDIEWVMPEVQERFKKKLHDLWLKKSGPSGAQGVDFAGSLTFAPWFYYDGNYFLFVEHGCQYDDANSFDFWLSPYRRDGTMELPSGSFFVRYLFNRVEKLYPFADNVKPATKFTVWALTRFKSYYSGEVFRVARSLWRILGKAGPIPGDLARQNAKRQEEAIENLARESGIPADDLRRLKANWAPSSMHHHGRFGLLLSFFANAKLDRKYYRNKAREVRRAVGARYVVFGHTHDADLFATTPEGESIKSEYVNSGTWTKSWASNYEEALLKSEDEFVYVHFAYEEERKDVKMDLLRWNDALGEGERVKLFSQF